MVQRTTVPLITAFVHPDVATTVSPHGVPSMLSNFDSNPAVPAETKLGCLLWDAHSLVADYVGRIGLETSFTLKLLGVTVGDLVSCNVVVSCGLRGDFWHLDQPPISNVYYDMSTAMTTSGPGTNVDYLAFRVNDVWQSSYSTQVWDAVLTLIGRVISVDARIRVLCTVDIFNSTPMVPKSYIDVVKPYASLTASVSRIDETVFWELGAVLDSSETRSIAVLPGSPSSSDLSDWEID